MFEKLLSTLPYSPGLLHQMRFYRERMREEASIRRTGIVFILLAFLIQFFAVISPPQPTSALDTNSLVSGGISSAADAKNKCKNNVRHYKEILAHYRISCDAVGAGTLVSIDPNKADDGREFRSMGWEHSANADDDTTVVVNKDVTVYLRKLSLFYNDRQPALHVKDANGTVYHILMHCGNLVTREAPKKPKPQPQPAPSKPSPPAPLPGQPSTPPKPAPTPTTPAPPAPCQYNAALPANSPQCFAPCPYNAAVSSVSPQCFAPCPLPGKGNLPQSSPECRDNCPYNASIPASDSRCFQPCQYNPSLPATSNQCFKPCEYNPILPADSPQCYKPCQYNPLIPAQNQQCKPCDKGANSEDTIACVSIHKKASNVTSNITDANGTTAQPGDVITYTLSATNNGKSAVKNFVFQESLSDVMNYADPTDLHGGSLDQYNTVSWPIEEIGPGATATHQITVTVKTSIPTTPTDPNNPDRFDLTMVNVYGDVIKIKVPAPPIKTIQTAAATLPNTGPGTTMLIVTAIMVIGGYFYGRARLLARESDLAIQENQG